VTFESPWVLAALVVVPLLIALYVRQERRRSAAAARFTNTALLPNLVSSRPGIRRHLPLALLFVALTAMIVGVARPHAKVSVAREEATVMIAIDSSLSMRATDVKPTRLYMARQAAKAFIAKVPKKFRIGLISFSARPYVILPPTQDRDLAARALASIRSGEGTALGDAVRLAVQVGRRQRAGDGSVPPASLLVISDGAQMSGRVTPEAAAVFARAHHVPVYAIVLGTQDGVVEVTLQGGFKEQIRVPPRADILQQVARTSGGEVFTARDDSRLREIYERLASRLGHRKQTREMTDLFAGGSAALLLVGGALSALWFRRVP
jgi:Ca-activated chloride channel family protein